MRRLKRHANYELQLQIKADDFIAPPRSAQRNWLINRAISELAWDLEAIHELAARFVPGVETLLSHENDSDALPQPEDIMELWQLPIMQRMADCVSASHGHVLEIGYGRGISAEMIQKAGVREHTIVECVPAIAQQCRNWAAEHGFNVNVLEGRWEEVQDDMKKYDGIFFHTYPMDSEEYAEATRRSATLAEPFFQVAANHLTEHGVFSYFSNEIDSLSRAHQRALFKHFRQISLEPLHDLDIPEHVKDTWWIDQMMIVIAARPKK
ncbi:MAG: class I SAM-dependent methyltransferase [Pseudomonadales bacterium]